MKITFVNHASFIIEHNGISVISDPWLEGRVFNNGWDLVSKTRMPFEAFRDIDYIWFSHEHPDHFSPPNLKKIPADVKKDITVLFQNTIDGRVADYCRKVGFKALTELEPGKTYPLGPDFEIMCEGFTEGDSWICYKAGGLTILTTNDCGILEEADARIIKEKIGGKVDILMTQFSYAYWAGGKDEVEFRQSVADNKLQLLKLQCDVFEPTVVIPIASFIYFCHQENFYLNDRVNTAARTEKFIRDNTKATPVVLYNGDEYTFGQEWNSDRAIAQYRQDFESIELSPERLAQNNPVPFETLKASADAFVDNLNKTNNLIVKSILKDTKIHLWDYDKTYSFSRKGSLEEKQYAPEECDVALSSESFAYCLKFPYGLDTTQINGRMQKPKGGHYQRFYNFFRIDQQKSRGQEMTVGYLVGAALRKVKAKLGLG
jgi:UDP-MurNAc hydroxylase